MKELFIHNLKAGWRNVMKYKTQNTISVLCLSVGTILFAIVLYFANALWESGVKYYFFNDSNKVSLEGIQSLDVESVNKLQDLPSVKSICFLQHADSTKVYVRNGTIEGGDVAYVSPDWLENHDFRSATTGKKIGRLKPGTIVSVKGNEYKEVNSWYIESFPWIGSRVEYDNKVGKVSDMVYSTTRLGLLPLVLIVVPRYHTYIDSIDGDPHTIDVDMVTLNDGYTAKQFKAQSEKIHIYSVLDKILNKLAAIAFFMVLILSSTVLVIGMSGYLKMQLQLFWLRSREMALRCCNGAKSAQLFTLLCSELLIVFLLTVIVTGILSVAFAEYAMPKIIEFGMTYSIYIDLPTIYRTEAIIIVLSFLAAIGIAWAVLRKMLRNPLNVSISSLLSQHPAWGKSLQVIQYVAGTVLLAVIGVLGYIMYSVANKNDTFENTSAYKKMGYAPNNNPDILRPMLQLPSVENYGWLYEVTSDNPKGICTLVYINETEYSCENTYVGNPETVRLLNIQIKKEKLHPDSTFENLPVFVRADEASSVIRQLKLKYKPSGIKCRLPTNDNDYVLLGWIDNHDYILSYIDCFVIEEKMNEYCNSHLQHSILLEPKNGDIDALLQQAGRYNVTTLYDSRLCSMARMFVFFASLLLILAVVTVISIVMTLYSSISLETRGKQKDVAIRKVNGAKTRDIVLLFSKKYIIMLGISFGVTAVLVLIFCAIDCYSSFEGMLNELGECSKVVIHVMLFIAVVTILTLWQKIYRISHVKPADLIKKE